MDKCLRDTRRRNKDGSEVAHLALAHNEWDPDTGMPKARVIHTFGRADLVERDGLARLVKSISRFLDPADAVAATAGTGEVRVLDSRPMGTAWVADRLWEPLGIAEQVRTVAAARGGPGRRVDPAVVERVIFDGRQPALGHAAVEAGRLLLGGPPGVHRRAGRGQR